MQVGLRPRLKGRTSFYDLIKQRNLDKLSIATVKFDKDGAELDPHPSLTLNTEEGSEIAEIQKSVRMVPVCLKSSL